MGSSKPLLNAMESTVLHITVLLRFIGANVMEEPSVDRLFIQRGKYSILTTTYTVNSYDLLVLIHYFAK